ncbi:MAG: hypothetical protein GX593_10920, partial [Actinomycetales bacterium]|nr:hypothetical protein [Actinomycetales bacterium]
MMTNLARRAAALVAATALVLVGLVAPASAAGTGTLSGKVTAPTGVGRTGWVELHRWDAARGSWSYVDDARVQEEGTYAFTGLEAGVEYTLEFDPWGTGAEGYAPEQTLGGTRMSWYEKQPGQVFKGTAGAQTVNFALHPGVSVGGKVIVPPGIAATDVTIELAVPRYWYRGDIRLLDGASSAQSIRLAADGSYSFARILPGEYSVGVRPESPEQEPVSLTGPGLPDSPTAIRRITADTTLPTVTMRKSVPVSGKVVSPEGAPFAGGGEVRLVEVDVNGVSSRVTTTVLAADGTYTFAQGAFPGRSYTVEAIPASGSSTYYGTTYWLDTAKTFAVGASGATVPDLPLITSDTEYLGLNSFVLRGAPLVGEELSVRSAGGRLGATADAPGAAVTYQWLRNGYYIPGATSPTYKVTPADLNTLVSVAVVARAEGHRSTRTDSSQVVVSTGSAPYATVYPVVSGAAKVGGRLSVSKGAWSVAGVTLKYQWLRDGKAIAGATSTSYVLQGADRGRQISVQITASVPGRVSGVSVTAPSAPVAAGDAAKATKEPKVTGTAKVGKKLKVSDGTWSVPGVRLARQWLRNGKAIAGATSTSYTLRAADRGKRISVRVTASVAGRANGVAVTAATGKVAYGNKAKAKKKPKITGTTRVGKKLKVSKVSWSLKGVKVTYQWLRNGKKISKATKKSYKLTSKDARKRISVRVTVRKAGYKTAKVVTKSTSKIK